MEKQDYPYCKHGTYVGGCGYDYMCGACEMGDPDPTPRQLLDLVVYEADKLARQRAEIEASLATYTPEDAAVARVALSSEFFVDYQTKPFHRALRHFENIFKLATHLDDDQWLNRLHARQEAEWRRMPAEDQFDSLPDYVLDGP